LALSIRSFNALIDLHPMVAPVVMLDLSPCPDPNINIESVFRGKSEVEKSFKGERPNSMLHLTPEGQVAFLAYCRNLKQFLDDIPE
jgi:hypothetical protein